LTGIHQVVVRAAPGESSTEAALALRSVLRRIGRSEIYAGHVDPALAGDVLPLAEFRRGAGTDLPIVYHASVGDADVLSFLLGRYEPVILVSQRTPWPEPLADCDPSRVQALAFGRAQLELLRDRVVLALADSAHSAAELADIGYLNVQACTLPVDVAPLRGAPDHAPTRYHFETQLEGPLLLFVGRLQPSERLEVLVGAYHVLVTHHRPDVHLAIAGLDAPPGYRTVIEEFIWKLGLHRAWIVERPTTPELATHYRFATAFVTASEDPEFCTPAVSAMAFDVPVVGRAAGGVADTAEGAALLVPPDHGPVLLAEALAMILDDGTLRTALVAEGRKRVDALAVPAVEATFLRQLAEVT
jgi:glycosyltransferase involved in cell wall biosynthesis